MALTLPAADELWLDGFSRGLFELAERFGVSLVGGNIARGPLNLTLELMGTVERANLLTRSGGHVGDGARGRGAGRSEPILSTPTAWPARFATASMSQRDGR